MNSDKEIIEALIGISERTTQSLQNMHTVLNAHLNETNRLESIIDKIADTVRDIKNALDKIDFNCIEMGFVNGKHERSTQMSDILALQKHVDELEKITLEIKEKIPEIKGDLNAILNKVKDMGDTNRDLVKSNEVVIKAVAAVGSLIILATALFKLL